MPRWTTNSGAALRLLRLLALMPILLPAAACTTLGSGTEVHFVDTSCTAFRPITYSSRDTPVTIDEVRAHNRVFDRLCPAGSAP